MMTHAEVTGQHRIAICCDDFRGTRYSGRGSTLYCVQRVVHWLLKLPRDRNYGQGRQQGRICDTTHYFCVRALSTLSNLLSVYGNATDLARGYELAYGSARRMSPRQRNEGWNGRCSAALGVAPWWG